MKLPAALLYALSFATTPVDAQVGHTGDSVGCVVAVNGKKELFKITVAFAKAMAVRGGDVGNIPGREPSLYKGPITTWYDPSCNTQNARVLSYPIYRDGRIPGLPTPIGDMTKYRTIYVIKGSGRLAWCGVEYNGVECLLTYP
ncbi:uncharacterized protein UV8b_07878 [Ustilaginoidea virens]|uniref:Uncharacterized protein n=1 Tax=Ustilaginoidea virens TaxID=1159556 RepID=A0A063C5E7_USTVR|nr:uncharacterized protein UV8b_07878 [Ustilaginoidea virens]QUC23637.1 hypothetical protein UV8b_07878 [Ustilaginoidea virens]GAO17531.1 hypothetical protein UVI_02003000 [Ustilaginoidea virens]